jgi:predicted phage terminase large subunit-like protein
VISRAERAALADLADEVRSTRSFEKFCLRMDPAYLALPHARMLCDYLQALADGDIQKLMIFMPPRHGKTYHASERFPAYYVGRSGGTADMIIGSYTARRAQASSYKVRELFREPAWPFPDVALDPESQAVNEWRTNHGAVIVATSVDGSSGGFGANLLVIDDPVKGRKQANSETYRESTWEWYTEVAARRMQANLRTPKRTAAKELICTTRWTEDDIPGRILNSGAASKWEVLRLPAIAEDDDPLGRPKGAELAPELGVYIPQPALGEISSRGFEALYQGNPTPLEGNLFKRSWFERRYRALPGNIRKGAIFLDGAWKEGVSNDRSALAAWVTDGVDYFIVDAWADRVEYPDLKVLARDFWFKHRHDAPAMAFCVEDAASGIPIIQEFKRSTSIPIVGVTVDKSKFTRAEAVSGLFEAKKVVLPDPDVFEAPWIHDFVEEHIKFTGEAGMADDYVDTSSGALARLANISQLSWTTMNTARRKGKR